MLFHFISELVIDKTPKFAKRTTKKLQYLQDTTSYKGTSKLGGGEGAGDSFIFANWRVDNILKC